jgi:hypothetical protein
MITAPRGTAPLYFIETFNNKNIRVAALDD